MGLFNSGNARSADQLASDFVQLIEEGREMLDEFTQKPAAAKASLRSTLEDVSDKLADYQASATKLARRGAKQGTRYARQADDYVRGNPWQVIAGGVVLGVIATLLLSQRR